MFSEHHRGHSREIYERGTALLLASKERASGGLGCQEAVASAGEDAAHIEMLQQSGPLPFPFALPTQPYPS